LIEAGENAQLGTAYFVVFTKWNHYQGGWDRWGIIIKGDGMHGACSTNGLDKCIQKF
jgi:hypothetical protein